MRQMLIGFVMLGLAAGMAKAGDAGSWQTGKNEVFAWGGATGLSGGLTTPLAGAAYGRYIKPRWQLEAGGERIGGSYGSFWARASSLFQLNLSDTLRSYGLVGLSNGWPEGGAGVKIMARQHWAGRVEYTTTLDDDAGWVGVVRAGVVSSF